MSDKLTKNHYGEVRDENSQKGHIYELQGSRCPDALFEKYLSKLSAKMEEFWQKPNSNFVKDKSMVKYW
jgi:hypothetical protein